jgi:hypothetical protein
MNGLRIAWIFIKNVKLDWRYFIYGPGIVALEILSRLLGKYDYKIWKRKPFAWSVVESTKDLAEVD